MINNVHTNPIIYFSVSPSNNNIDLLLRAINSSDLDTAFKLFQESDKQEWPHLAPSLNYFIALLIRDKKIGKALEVFLELDTLIFQDTGEQLLKGLAEAKMIKLMLLLFFILVTKSQNFTNFTLNIMSQAVLASGDKTDKQLFQNLMEINKFESPVKKLMSCNNLEEAEALYQKVKSPDQLTFFLLIPICCQCNQLTKGVYYFQEMIKRGFYGDLEIVYLLMELCETMNAESQALSIYLAIKEQEFAADNSLNNIVIRCNLKLGSLSAAYELYLRNKEGTEVITFQLLIEALAKSGFKQEEQLVREEFYKQLMSLVN